MPWPLSQDYNEAIQTPAQCFADDDLRQGEAITDTLGLPIPCSGNFADVYAVASGPQKWAIKCFTRQIPGLRERYVEISKYLQQVQLPFMVEFKYLDQGIRVRGQWYPILKMQWVEGLALNTFARANLENTAVLQSVCQIWLRLAARLREANLAHGDLQHGNVIIVPGQKAGTASIKLVDYDGMCVPSLELLKATEVGHPSYQHPQRLREATYGLHIDNFSHLVIYTALKVLTVSGRKLWERYDNGDNLLFSQSDFVAPNQSALFKELLTHGDAEVRKLAAALAEAVRLPVQKTPRLEDVLGTAPRPKTAIPKQAQRAEPSPFATSNTSPRARQKTGSKGVVAAVLVACLAIAGVGLGAFAIMSGGDGGGTQPSKVASAKTTPLPPTPTLPAKPVDLLALVDPAKHQVKGSWTKQGNMLLSPPGLFVSIQIPYVPPDEYTLTMTVERRGGTDGFVIGLPGAAKQAVVVLSGWSRSGGISGLDPLDGKGAPQNQTRHFGLLFKNGVPSTIVCQVRRRRIAVTVDGKQVIDFEGDFGRLSTSNDWLVPNKQVFFLGTDESVYAITKMDLLPLTGEGHHVKLEPIAPVETTPLRPAILKRETWTFRGTKESWAKFSNLTFEVGMGGHFDGMGHADAGIEIENVRRIKLSVEASDKLQHLDVNSFAGFYVDYHTEKGYTKRVAFGAGMRDDKRGDKTPVWGKVSTPDQFVGLGKKDNYDLDLQQWAPEGWDRKVWFVVSLQNTGKDTRFKAKAELLGE